MLILILLLKPSPPRQSHKPCMICTLNFLLLRLGLSPQKEHQQISVNAAYRGGRGGGRGPMRGHGDGSFRGGRDGDRNGGPGGNKIPYQVCGKTGHGALLCYKRFDASNNGEEKHALAATTGYNVDTEWYTDTGVTNHITSELDKLTMKEKYGGLD
jgi:hypothetical protein